MFNNNYSVSQSMITYSRSSISTNVPGNIKSRGESEQITAVFAPAGGEKGAVFV